MRTHKKRLSKKSVSSSGPRSRVLKTGSRSKSSAKSRLPAKPTARKRVASNRKKSGKEKTERAPLLAPDVAASAAVELAEQNKRAFEFGEIVAIAKAMGQERDIDRLLPIILEKSRLVTGADAGSIYVLEEKAAPGGERRLLFKLSQNDSVQFESQQSLIAVSYQSVVGSTVLLRRPINIADIDKPNPEISIAYDSSFDRRSGYRTRSVLSVPLISAQDEVIGVIQLINKKTNPSHRLTRPADFAREVVPFDERSEQLARALAGLAGVALENALLYGEIQEIFAGFVHASVQAIEQRDPTTSGHSLRVTALSCELARRVDAAETGPYGAVRFSGRQLQELRYAALLHDFGKIGVREKVLTKSKKLYPDQFDALERRFEFAMVSAEVEYLRERARLAGNREELAILEQWFEARRQQLRADWLLIERVNEPGPLSEGAATRIRQIAEITYIDSQGNVQRLLESAEEIALCVSGGTLTPAEFQEIRSHVVHTRTFLEKIPWGKSMAQIPAIAAAHHERLDGSGYPDGLSQKRIGLTSRIIAVADVYDALTARDRPYKKATSIEAALALLEAQAERGYLDKELVRIFREDKVYAVTITDPPRISQF
jgi:HD-GYP domain-containing protein (c-di-GMP phosphodiesterase class II)